jgi:hypothetical protein
MRCRGRHSVGLLHHHETTALQMLHQSVCRDLGIMGSPLRTRLRPSKPSANARVQHLVRSCRTERGHLGHAGMILGAAERSKKCEPQNRPLSSLSTACGSFYGDACDPPRASSHRRGHPTYHTRQACRTKAHRCTRAGYRNGIRHQFTPASAVQIAGHWRSALGADGIEFHRP